MDTFESTRLNWEVEKKPLIFVDNNMPFVVPNHFVNVRTDIQLPVGVVGTQYTIIQNRRVYDAVQNIFDGKAELITAGSLFNCRQIWFLAKINEGTRTINGDRFENYLLASSSHDGSRRLEFRTTNVRVVCNNTLTYAVNSTKDCFVVPHSACSEIRVIQAEKFYGEVFDGINKTQAVLELLADKSCTIETAYNWAAGFVKARSTRSQNIARKIANLFQSGIGNHGQTRYDLLNGVTERFTHGHDETDDNDTAVKRFVSSTFESNAGKKVSALNALAIDEKFDRLVEQGEAINREFASTTAAMTSKSLIPVSFN